MAGLLTSSCSEDYLDTVPTSDVTEADVLSSTENAYAALNGIHRMMYSQHNSRQNQGGEGTNKIFMDALGEDWVQTAQGNGWFNGEHNWTSHRNATSTTTYNHAWYYFYYRIIANANMLINGLDNATGSEAEKEMVIGQALVYRAWAHFQLVQAFGERYDASKTNSQLGIPLALTNTTEGQPRATVEEVYAQVNQDLDLAITKLANAPARAEKSHFNVWVAKGVKARVALTMQNWASASSLAKEVIAGSGASLMTQQEYLGGFNSVGNREWLWGSKMIPDQTSYFYSFFAYMSSNYNSSYIRTNPRRINSLLYDKIAETDVRKKVWSPTGTGVTVPSGGVKPTYIQNKFRVADTGSSIGDVPHMRLAEMYLIAAEADARRGEDALALGSLNTLLIARGAPASTKAGKDLIDEILIQRRIELWGEGFRFLDLKRTNSPLDRTGANHPATFAWAITTNNFVVPAGAKEWQFLFPQREIDTNKAIVQNPL